MNGRVIFGDLIMGVVLGVALYFAGTAIWPAAAGPVTLVLVISASLVAVLFRAPGGALYRPGAAPLVERGQRAVGRVTSADLASLTISPLLLKAMAAWFLGAIVLALLVPALSKAGIQLQQWMAWAVVIASFSLLLGPDLVRRHESRHR
jgi:hypothetical protein